MASKNIGLFLPAVAVLCSAIVGMNLWGEQGKKYSGSPGIIRITDPLDTIRVWGEQGIRGRILFTFDRHLNGDESSHAPGDSYIMQSIKRNMVRTIYHIIPDASWEEVSNNLSKYSLVSKEQGYYRLFLEDGTPVHVMRIADIPVLREKILLNIHAKYWDGPQWDSILRLVSANALSADLITIIGTCPDDAVARLSDYAGQN